jgi:hypothetical protein
MVLSRAVLLAAEQVGQLAAEQQQAAERQRVGGDDPLPFAVREVQRQLRRRQRDVHHRHVEHDHQLSGSDHRQDQPLPVHGHSLSRHRMEPYTTSGAEYRIGDLVYHPRHGHHTATSRGPRARAADAA